MECIVTSTNENNVAIVLLAIVAREGTLSSKSRIKIELCF